MKVLARVALGALGLVIGALAVSALREATMSTHHRVAPDSRSEVVVSARSRGAERNQTLGELVEALVLTCRLEVASDVDGAIEADGDDRFRFDLVPSLDETNRRQFRGCIQDFSIDQLRADVVSITAVG